MEARRDQVERLAAETGYASDAIEKVVRLIELLDAVGREPRLKDALALKGGTPLNLCFGPPPRLSVDLDFNAIGAIQRDEMLRQRPMVERAITTIAEDLFYRIETAGDAHAGTKFALRYAGVAGGESRVEIDVNFVHRVPIGAPEARTIGLLPDGPAINALVVSLDELFIGKLLAYLDRGAPRDIFDVARLPSIAGDRLQLPQFRALFVALAGILPHPVHSYAFERLRRLDTTRVQRELWPMLRPDRRPSVADLIERSWQVIAPLLASTEAEREYSDRLQRGELRLDLLFAGDSPWIKTLSLQPALRWKVENARAHATSRKEREGR